MKKLIFVLLVAPILASAAIAQPPPAASSRPSGEVKKFRGWPSVNSLPAKPSFVSLEGRFSVGLPKNIQGFGALSPKQTGTNASGQQFTWKFAEAEVTGSFLDFPDSSLTGSAADVRQIAANAKKSVTDRLPNAKLLSESAATVSGIPSESFVYDLGTEGFISIHLFLDQKRLYRFASIFKDRSTEAILNTAFRSFRLVARAEVDDELRKKYEAMMPAPLPQSPVVAKQTSDSADAGLKGKVKKVVTESEDRSGTGSVQDRKPTSVAFYDQNGALTQRDSYDFQGNPFQITVYGYIDGKRVSNSGTARYEYNPPPPAAAPPGIAKSQPARKSDSRYEYSFEYKYENGKLIERQMIFNNGRKGMRYVYKYSPNQVEEFVYTDEGKLNQRYLSVLDANGNELERTDFGLANFHIYGDRKYKSSYEFDSSGNWIKKTTSRAVTKNGVTTWQPFSVYYRTISYY